MNFQSIRIGARSVCAATVVALGMAVLAGGQVGADQWPSWRGDAQGSGTVAPGVDVPLHWTTTKNVRWRVEMPERGNSTPIVWGDRIFVTQALTDKDQRTLMCLDRSNGKLLWQKGAVWKSEETTHRTNPYCSASPVTDGERVVAWFGSAGIYAYDFSGREIWHRDLGPQKHTWGYGTSPLLYQDLCILFFGPGERQVMVALDKKTGKTVWETKAPQMVKRPRTDGFRGKEAGGMVGTFSTPIIVQSVKGDELVMSYPQLILGYDPKTGRELWRCDGLNELIYASPIAGDGVVVGMGGYFGTSVALKMGGRGDVTKTHVLWQKERTKNRLGSALVHKGHIYIFNSDGIAECLELKTGRTVWEERLPKKGPKGDSWSSLVRAGDLIYVLNQSGDTVVFKASPKFEVVTVNPLDGTLTNASLAVVDGELFIRTHSHLWCIGSVDIQAANQVSPPSGLRLTLQP